MTPLRDETGFTLIEVLVAATLLIVILGATLGTFTQFNNNTRLNQLQNDSQEDTRVAIDRAARGIRNAGSSTTQNPQSIEKAEPYDLVYQDVEPTGIAAGLNDRNIRRVRYCLDSTTTGGATLWRGIQTFPALARPAAPSTASCPGPWPKTERVAGNVVNRYQGQDRPVFVYDGSPTTASNRLRIQLWVDVNPGERPRESRLDTAVILRNRSSAPTAAFTWSALDDARVVLNGSPSDDAEGDRLSYRWFDGAVAIGEGLTLEYRIATGEDKTITLKVYDGSGYEASVSQVVDR